MGLNNPVTPASIGAVPTTRKLIAGANVTIDGAAEGELDEDLTIASSGGGGGGALELIQQITGDGTVGTYTFADIADIYKDLIISIQAASTDAANYSELRMRFNADAGNNYDFQGQQGTTNLSQGEAGITQSFMKIGGVPGAGGVANDAGSATIDIVNYNGSTFFKQMLAQSGFRIGDAAASQFIYNVVGYWSNTAAIDDITIFLSVGNFATGSKLTLWGRS